MPSITRPGCHKLILAWVFLDFLRPSDAPLARTAADHPSSARRKVADPPRDDVSGDTAVHPPFPYFDYSLALVSRSFRVDVEAQFYKYVAVPEKRLLFFCRTMLARPDLARRVQRLAFTGAVHREPEAADTDLVAQMMKLLVNLKDLSITACFISGGPGSHGPCTTTTCGSWTIARSGSNVSGASSRGENRSRGGLRQPQLRVRARRVPGSCDPAEGDDGAGGVVTPCHDVPPLCVSPHLAVHPCVLQPPRDKPQPVALRFDMRFITVREE